MKNSDFITGRVPITKEEVRAVSIMKLDLVNAKRFIDVGAGTGSVSVEAAYNYPNLEVISIERNDDALDLINKNVEKFNLKNVEVGSICEEIRFLNKFLIKTTIQIFRYLQFHKNTELFREI